MRIMRILRSGARVRSELFLFVPLMLPKALGEIGIEKAGTVRIDSDGKLAVSILKIGHQS